MSKRGYTRHEAWRDWACAQTESFTAADMAAAMGRERNAANYHIKQLLKRGTIVALPFEATSGTLKRYRFVKPVDPGAAHTLSAKARRVQAAARGGSPVAGTGRGHRVVNKEVRALLKSAKDGGAHFEMGGTGHYKIMRDGEIIDTVPATPNDRRSLANAKAKLKRKGVL